MSAILLMYHRVCAPSPSTGCYFARGTAVTPATFERHLDELGRRFRFASLREALAPDSPDPLCALTFDDGYIDVAEVVHPICAARNIPVAVFPIAAHLGESPGAAWFDTYYDLLHRATRRSGVPPEELGLEGGLVVPPIDDDVRWWVRGPLKHRLAGLADAVRVQALEALAQVLATSMADRLAARLYLQRTDLAALQRHGAVIGGHGATHARLDALSPGDARDELLASASLLDELAVPHPRVFCYPDGGCPEHADSLLPDAGFTWGLSVAPGPWTGGGDPMRIPRYLMREGTTPFDIEEMRRALDAHMHRP
jgi:peptidoglycan/xylan/chitin deacetylase (PgdA/CDA1 family)